MTKGPPGRRAARDRSSALVLLQTETDRQTESETEGETDRQTDRQTDRGGDRQPASRCVGGCARRTAVAAAAARGDRRIGAAAEREALYRQDEL